MSSVCAVWHVYCHDVESMVREHAGLLARAGAKFEHPATRRQEPNQLLHFQDAELVKIVEI
jgi:hypothetical protein